jgi:hypothetical protein
MRITPRHFGIGIGAPLLLIGLLFAGLAAGQPPAAENPYRVKAAFLRNFARYVTWPTSAFADTRAPWHICVLGRDPFGEVLDATLQGRTEQGRGFEAYRADTLAGLPACQIVYVAYRDTARRRAALAALKDQPILTVGEAGEFLAEGGMIRFQVGDRVEMGINLDQTRSASLSVQTKMLEVSSEVWENGTVRVLR